MKTNIDVQLKTITMDRNNSIKSAVVKDTFLDWLINSQAKNSNIDNIIFSIDNASEQLLNRKISLASLWEITNPSIFAAVYKKAQNDKFFRVMDKKAHSSFIKDGQIYLKFLKSKPDFQSYTVKYNDSAHGEKTSASMTIREAIIKVLSDEEVSMTADKVYSKIIEYSLYAFGAQNPINVVRNVLDSSCDNSGYSGKYKSAIPCFHFEKDENGKRVYSLLESMPLEAASNNASAKGNATITSISISDMTFSEWLKSIEKMADGTCRSYVSALYKAEAYAQEHNLPSRNISDVDGTEALSTISYLMEDEGFRQINQDQHNRFSAAFQKLAKYYNYINSDRTHAANVSSIYASEKVKMPPTPKADTTPTELAGEFCFQCGHEKDQILAYSTPKGSVPENCRKNAEPRQGGNGVNIYKAEEYLLSQGLAGATVQKIISVVQPSASIHSTRKALDESTNVIAMPQNMYVHADAFVDLDEVEVEFAKIFKTHFADFGGYSNSALLYGAAALDMSLFLNDNDCDNADSVFAIARYLFEEKAVAGKPYKFASPHIFENKPDFPLSLKGLMINLARRNGGVLGAEEAKDYLQKTMLSYGSIGQLLQVSSDNTFFMYDDSHYILSEKIGIDEAWINTIHEKLDNLFRQADVAYVIPRDINSAWFDTLPVLPMGMRWTMLILQEVLQKYSTIGFKPVKSELGQSYNTIAAAIVPQGSPIQTFPDVVTLYMQERHQLPIKMACEDLRIELREAGMLEGNELIYSLYKALDDYRFAWTNENKTVLVRGN